MNPTQQKLNARRRHVRGFTLIEIMVVITILGLIAAAVGVSVMSNLEEAKQKTAALDIKTLETGLKLHCMKTGSFPETQAGLEELLQARSLERLPQDPWNRDYVYMNEGGSPVILSYGADGAPGGDGSDADISSQLESPSASAARRPKGLR
ncbi:type II secretion system major pseudopilin GspG [Myxococcus sp. AB056]|uniref:type II secretion system major pseudopilin GspG n=1 Tax=Myxococcus sp. AB056 TaxID=2562792 RepID=UPI0011479DEA|nr:type II secretion system major pseudopilin GspG [Myxococcus sp. AB056]